MTKQNIHITYDMAKQGLETLAFMQPDRQAECMNVGRDNGKPHAECLVGTYFAMLGVPLHVLERLGTVYAVRGFFHDGAAVAAYGTQDWALWDMCSVTLSFDDDALDALSVAQTLQDTKMTWSAAVRGAFEEDK